jgi:DNA-directed RNA polymerase beta' subunit
MAHVAVERLVLEKPAFPVKEIASVGLELVSPEDIVRFFFASVSLILHCVDFFFPQQRRFSVLRVCTEQLYEDRVTYKPSPTGLLSPLLGAIGDKTPCTTCSRGRECIGHFGHIELHRPVFHPGYLPDVKRVLACLSYHSDEAVLNVDRVSAFVCTLLLLKVNYLTTPFRRMEKTRGS